LDKREPKTRSLKLALVGGETLLGRELQDVLKTRAPGSVVKSYAATGEGNFSEAEGEAVYLQPLEAAAVSGEDAVLVAGSPEGALKAYELAKAAGGHPPVIDCTGFLEHQPEARIVGTLPQDPDLPPSWLLIVAHPVANALALILNRLSGRAGIHQAVAQIFEPASERGQAGVSELHQQTASLLAFKTLPKKIFDAQLSFNLLSRYGEDAPTSLISIEQRVERHLASLLSNQPPGAAVRMPSLRLIQAPVFHGYSISLWVEFDTNTSAAEVGEALAGAEIEVRGEQDEPPDSIGAAGQSGLIAGDIRVDPNNPHGVWLWVVGDNLRLTADVAAGLSNQFRTTAK
jgi:aspartate-semialdehyde dehydrogenase